MRDLFTWGRRKKAFYPNGEINWNILMPPQQQQSMRQRSGSSPQLHDSCGSSKSSTDSSISADDRATGSMPYFLPVSRQQRPSLDFLFSSPLNGDFTDRGIPLPDSPNQCYAAGSLTALDRQPHFLTTFQPDLALVNHANTARGLCHGLDVKLPATPKSKKDHNRQRSASSLSASVEASTGSPIKTEPPANRAYSRSFSTSTIPQMMAPHVEPKREQEYRQILVNRPAGQKFSLNLDIAKDKKSKRVRQVVIKTVCFGQSSDTPLQVGDQILRLNALDLTTLTRRQCVKLFQKAPSCFTLLIRRTVSQCTGTGNSGTVAAIVTQDARAAAQEFDQNVWCSRSKPVMPRKRPARPNHPPPPPPEDAKCQLRRELRESYYDIPCSDKAQSVAISISPSGSGSWVSMEDDVQSGWSGAFADDSHAVSEVSHSLTSFRSPSRHYASAAVALPGLATADWDQFSARHDRRRSWPSSNISDGLGYDYVNDESYCDTVSVRPDLRLYHTSTNGHLSLAADPEQGQEDNPAVLRPALNLSAVPTLVITADTLRRRKETLIHVSPTKKPTATKTPLLAAADSSSVAPSVLPAPDLLPKMTDKERILHMSDLLETSVDEPPTPLLTYSTPRSCKQVTFLLDEKKTTQVRANGVMTELVRRSRDGMRSVDGDERRESIGRSILKKSPRNSFSNGMEVVKLDLDCAGDQTAEPHSVPCELENQSTYTAVKGQHHHHHHDNSTSDGHGDDECARPANAHFNQQERSCQPGGPSSDGTRPHALHLNVPVLPVGLDDSYAVSSDESLISGMFNGNLSEPAQVSACSTDDLGQTLPRTMALFEDGPVLLMMSSETSSVQISSSIEEASNMSEWNDLPPLPLLDQSIQDLVDAFSQHVPAEHESTSDDKTSDQINQAWLNCLTSPWPQPPSLPPSESPLQQRRWSVPELNPANSEPANISKSCTDVNPHRQRPVPPPKPQFLLQSRTKPLGTPSGNKPQGKLATLSSLNSSTPTVVEPSADIDTAHHHQPKECNAPVTVVSVGETTFDQPLIDLNEDSQQHVQQQSFSLTTDDFLAPDPVGLSVSNTAAMLEYATSLEWMRHSCDSGYTGDHTGQLPGSFASPLLALTDSVSADLTASRSISSSVSGRSSDSGSELEFEGGSSSGGESSVEVEGTAGVADERVIEILHISWDIGIKVRLNERQECVVAHLMRNARCPGLSEGDVVRTVNGQKLDGMSELQISTLLRALPRGLVKLTVRSGTDHLKGLSDLPDVPTDNIKPSSVQAVQSSMSDPFSTSSASHYTFSHKANYGYTQHLPSQASSIIEPVARTEVSLHGKSAVHVGQPTEFVIKINKLAQNGQQTLHDDPPAKTTTQTTALHYDPSRKPTFDLMDAPLAPQHTTTTQSHVNSERRRNYFTTESSSSTNTSDSAHHDSMGMKSNSDPYRAGRDQASDEFKKKREKFLGISQVGSNNGFFNNLDRKHSLDFSPTNGKEFVIPIQREEPAVRGDLFGKYEPIEPVPNRQRNGDQVMGEHIIPIRREEPATVVNIVKVEPKTVSPTTTFSAGANNVTVERVIPVEPAKKLNRVHREEPPAQTFSSHRTIHTGRKPQPAATAPPMTQVNRNWQDQRGRSSSISSASSSTSLHSFSSNEVPAKSSASPITANETTVKAQMESRVSSGASGWVSPAQVSRHVPGRKDSAGTTPSRFSEAMARYKEKTEATPETEVSGRVTERRGSRPLVVPVANKSVQDKASMFEQKQQDAAPVAPPAYLSQRTRSLSQSSLTGTLSPMSPVKREPTGRSPAKILISPAEEPDAEVPSWKARPKTTTMVHDISELKQTNHQDELSAVRASRDSGVSSRNSSVTYEHEVPPNDAFPPPPPMEMDIFSEPRLPTAPADKIPLPPPPVIEENFTPTVVKKITSKSDTTARKYNLPAPVEEIDEPVRLARPMTAPMARTPSPAPVANRKAVEPVVVNSPIDSLSEDSQQLVELAKTILGADAATEEVHVIELARPDGSTGGGVGLVLTGGADYEVNQIKVNKVISHSLAHRDGRVMAGDRLLLINAQPCSNMTHRQALEVLKSPRALVSLVLSRPAGGRDLAMTKTSSPDPELALETVTVKVDKSGLGLTIHGGSDRPLTIRRVSKGAMSEPDSANNTDAAHRLEVGDELVAVNGIPCQALSRLDCTKLLKSVPEGEVATLTIRR